MKENRVEEDERWKRPTPERTQPIRNWSTILGANGETARAPHSNPTPAGGPDPVSRAVELGYRVIDEYIRQGQNAARRFSEGGMNGGALTATWQDAATRMAQLSGEWMGLWLELAQRAAGSAGMPGAGPAARAFSAPFTTPTAPPEASPLRSGPAASARVRLQVSSARPTEVTLDLRPECTATTLVVHSLRAVDPNLPRISDVGFTPAANDQPAVLTIRVAPEHPAGTYSAVIVDAKTNRPAGTVSVTVADHA
ncbi:MAG: hypothetical protein HY270_13365 [Deltaproteobacteria bacterium]|nr:hypothetical protein [Deltaproteobacteria bacterium]